MAKTIGQEVKKLIREELNKYAAKKAKSSVLKENVQNLYDAVKLVEDLKKKKSPKLPLAQKALVIAEGRLHEFFEEEYEEDMSQDEIPDDTLGLASEEEGGQDFGEEESEEDDVDDNSRIYDCLLSIMECAKDLYMKIDLDTEVGEWLTSKIIEAEAVIRTASEFMNKEMEENEEDAYWDDTHNYIGDGEYTEDELGDDDEECDECDDDANRDNIFGDEDEFDDEGGDVYESKKSKKKSKI